MMICEFAPDCYRETIKILEFLNMKKTIYKLLFVILTVSFISCSTAPEPIRYGEDSCHFCEMTIVSQVHSAQAVSKKGKQFKYDAIECMMNDIIKNQTEMAVKRVANFSRPGEMIDVESAGFIVHDSINSPMGENLAAIEMRKNENLYTWSELKARFLGEDSVTLNHK